MTTNDDIDWTDTVLKCPKCGFTGNMAHYDCVGADENKLFCNQCNHHGKMRLIKHPPQEPPK